jgi:CoA:oxalate CoA-transferase
MPMALSDLRVLEIGQEISAPYCCKLLADLGADVVKIEEQGIGDSLRSIGSFPDDPDDPTVGALFRYLNTNKRSMAIDLLSKDGAETVRNLVLGTDIIIENLGVGGLVLLPPRVDGCQGFVLATIVGRE